MMPRSESVAYASANSPQTYIARILHFGRLHATAVTATLCFIVFLSIMTSDDIAGTTTGSTYKGLRFRGGAAGAAAAGNDPHWGGAVHSGYFTPESAKISNAAFHFAAVTDLDQLSRLPNTGEKPKFHSYLIHGVLNKDAADNRYSMEFSPPRELFSKHNEAGRGMELSELTLYQNRLLAFDDRTGSIFEVLSKNEKDSFVVPRFVITEGEGDTDKGMKWEWATVKDDVLYIGSMGKEYTNPDGSIANSNNLWIARVNSKGEVEREDWTPQYNFVRELLGAQPPGYVIHEAVLFSNVMRKWLFIPRRVSYDAYNDELDERKGATKIVIVNEDFTKGEVVDIQLKGEDMDPLHGFSTAAFVPDSDEQHIAAIRSVEEDCVGGDESLCKQRSYVMVFHALTGEVLMDEVKIDQDVKYEGIEFVDITRTGQ